jgi:hypothetical protein
MRLFAHLGRKLKEENGVAAFLRKEGVRLIPDEEI